LAIMEWHASYHSNPTHYNENVNSTGLFTNQSDRHTVLELGRLEFTGLETQ